MSDQLAAPTSLRCDTDQYRRDGGAWLFAERWLALLSYMELAELADGGLSASDRERDFGTIGAAEIPEKLDT